MNVVQTFRSQHFDYVFNASCDQLGTLYFVVFDVDQADAQFDFGVKFKGSSLSKS